MCPQAADAQTPLFTIITVCFNAERSIARTIESVLAQQDVPGDVEHLVIDGASKDGTLQVLGRFPHLRVVSEPDRGIYDAMNKGVRLSRGRIIGILNADDWYEPHALASVARVFEQLPESDIVHGDVHRWAGAKSLGIARPPQGRAATSTLVIPLNHPACFVRREVFDDVGLFDLSYPVFADYDWVRRVVRAGKTLTYCPEVLTNFRVGGVSTMRIAWRERYRVFRANGASVLSAWRTIGYTSMVVLRNHLRRSDT